MDDASEARLRAIFQSVKTGKRTTRSDDDFAVRCHRLWPKEYVALRAEVVGTMLHQFDPLGRLMTFMLTRGVSLGWLRLGFSLSLLWVLGACAFAAYDFAILYHLHAGWEAAGHPGWEVRNLLVTCGASSQSPVSRCSLDLGRTVSLVICPVVAGWILAMGLAKLYRWVRDGFRADQR
ncbi:hypothetical protein [Paraburkholderia sp. GAS334]|uniref:hypothetical protein n=1 Tax=Paraburkholderia sp. GAS334 TaxID=3035131 RepID=UPI003D2130A2